MRFRPWSVLFFVLAWFLSSACGTLEVGIEPASSRTPGSRATAGGSSAVIEASTPTLQAAFPRASIATPPLQMLAATATVAASGNMTVPQNGAGERPMVAAPVPTSAQTAGAATETFRVPPTDLCREYLDLSVLYEETEERAVATSYRCQSASIDSTGQSSSKSPDLVVHRGTPIHLQLAVEQRPTAIDVRLYPGAGVSATFLRWPEELPTQLEAVDQHQPEPHTGFRYVPQAPPGEYSLVIRATWEGDVDVFYAISLVLT